MVAGRSTNNQLTEPRDHHSAVPTVPSRNQNLPQAERADPYRTGGNVHRVTTPEAPRASDAYEKGRNQR